MKVESISLIEQAASIITLADASDREELQHLQLIIAQTTEQFDTLGVSAESVQTATELLTKVDDALQSIFDSSSDSDGDIEIISQSICQLQEIIKNDSQELPPVVEPIEETEVVIPEDDLDLVQDFIAEAAEHIESAESGLLDLEHNPGDNEIINQVFRAFHTIKGLAGFLNFQQIGSLAHSAENLLDLARNGELVLTSGSTDVVLESIDTIKKMMASLQLAVDTDKIVLKYEGLDVLLEKLDLWASGKGEDTPASTVDEKEIEKPQASTNPKTTNITKNTSNKDERIKVSTARLDALVNMVGELVIAQLMVSENLGRDVSVQGQLGYKIAQQGKIVRELQELSLSMRMVPIHRVFQKMTRMVRDLSKKSGKEINFVTSGEETELDRNIVDKIADPLVHMLRNSIDHGIEPIQQRTEAGKNAVGTIALSASHQAGHIVIEIADDGKGLDKERILNKAIENGVVEQGQELSDEEIFKLIFHPGLSTAQKVTDVSGRGVGMDVVKKNIESLRGKVDIRSTFGNGTIFTIRLPLTLAIIDGQTVQVGDERYVIPITSIIRSFRPTADQISSVNKKGEMVMVDDQLMPLLRLYKHFDITSAQTDPVKALMVMTEEDGKRCCLLVDELFGQQQVVIKNLGQALGRVKGISGGAIMGDGRVSLILDIASLIDLSQGRQV